LNIGVRSGIEELDAQAFLGDVDLQLLGDVGQARVGRDGVADLGRGALELDLLDPIALGAKGALLDCFFGCLDLGFGLLAAGARAALGRAGAGACSAFAGAGAWGGAWVFGRLLLGRHVAGVVILDDGVGLGRGEFDGALVADHGAVRIGGLAGERGARSGRDGREVAGR